MSLIAECNGQTEEDAAWAAGYEIVVRKDLLLFEKVALLLHFEGAENGTSFVDSSQYNRTVTRVGEPVTGAASAKFGATGMKYTGAGNYLTCQDAPDLRLNADWTIETWHRMNTAHTGATHGFIASKGAAGDLNNSWYLGILAGSSHIMFIPANNTPGINVLYPYASDLTNSHHVSLNSVSGVVTLYIDGAAIGSCVPGSDGVPAICNGTGPLYVGGWNYTTANTEGDHLDEFFIMTGVALRTGNFTPPSTPIW